MAPAILSYFGYGASQKAPTVVEEKSSVRALPASWYTSKEMYQLERRSIFSKRWLLITHKSRFSNTGDWLKYSIAGFEFILCRDREGTINGFHNICRHRAYPVVEGQQGTAKIFACRYHGWSYGLNGKLAKAPQYQELEGFDKSKNSLFPIHTRLDANGFVWVNFDAKETPDVAWESDFDTVDKQKKYEQFNFENYAFDHTWEMKGAYNWKISADNYNECYHCATTHPDVPAVADLETYWVDTQGRHIQHHANTSDEQKASGNTIASTFYFPNASMSVSPHFFFTQRFEPSGPTSSTIRYEVFRNKTSTEEEFQNHNQMFKRIMTEDKGLCEAAQKNIDGGVFVNGELHPRVEKGPLFFQRLCREDVTAHHAREQAAKMEIWPARQTLPDTSTVSQDDIDFCSGLSCAPENSAEIAW